MSDDFGGANPPRALVPDILDEADCSPAIEEIKNLFDPAQLAALTVKGEELMLMGFDKPSDLARQLRIDQDQAVYLRGYIQNLWEQSSGREGQAMLIHQYIEKAKLLEKKAVTSAQEYKGDWKAQSEFMKMQLSAQKWQAQLLGLGVQETGKGNKSEEDFEAYLTELRKKRGIKEC